VTLTASDLAGTAQAQRPERAPARNGAEALIQLFAAQGVEYIFLNPGTDTAPLQEAVVALGRDGRRIPTIVPCLYENVALAAAHAFFQITHRPQVVVCHVDVGTQNLGGNLHNTQRGQAGVVILAGRSPYTVDGGVPGGRNRSIQWQQDQLDQIGIVRNYVKWAHELSRTDTLHHLVPRAFQIAASEPSGAVYMMAAREVLMEPMDGVSLEPTGRALPLVTPAADPAALVQVAGWLAEAEAPLALVGNVGRHPGAVAELTALCELLGLPVVDTRGLVNLPSSNPLFLGGEAGSRLGEADLLLLLDADVPYIPEMGKPKPGARIAQIDIDPVKQTVPLWGFPVDLPIQADTAKALPALRAAVERLATPERRASWQARRSALTAARAEREARLAESAEQASKRKPIPLEWLARAFGQMVPAEALVLEEAVTSSEVIRRHLRRDQPGSLLNSGAPGLGWALGAGVGARLANPGRDVIAIVGDGSFVFGSPVAALWAAQQANAPFMAVIINNGGYNASKMPVLGLFPRGASATENAFPGVRFPTPPDYAALARSCHAHGERVEDPAALPEALQRALAAIRAGQAAVVDVVVEPI
jgi:acetolactate synthase-1/2/3 large subunit